MEIRCATRPEEITGVSPEVPDIPVTLLTNGGPTLHEVSPVSLALARMNDGPGPTGTVHPEVLGDCSQVSGATDEGAALLRGKMKFEQPSDVPARYPY